MTHVWDNPLFYLLIGNEIELLVLGLILYGFAMLKVYDIVKDPKGGAGDGRNAGYHRNPRSMYAGRHLRGQQVSRDRYGR